MAPQSLLQLLLVASAVAADVPVWSQCGGSNYAGPTACASGNYCSFGNPWYSQCLPGSVDEPLDSNIPDSPLETNTVQTIITIGGNQGNGGAPPVTLTTSYTFLLPSTTIYAHHHTSTQTPAPPSPGGGGGGGGGGDGNSGPPLLTVIGGTTYTILPDAPATGNNKRTAVAPVAARATTLYNDGRPLIPDEALSLQKEPVKATPTAQWTTIVTVKKA
ncbi:uncharacterized protein SPSK_09745 [Sporothrix schenckii 1099-18]|uniref:CBM1 domain-containing protein n=1 Tax=Sporothrix schenckii 1099-18 TaxID=1397361 RepID=A0A0F2M351_SPOSC|nr:uncharacterized protein SPSK_09745 [Sporothrix schenckii 1099-18]KJR84143.1 hypothetical protein SPSK_09745 [Sporothrix schenckii 1099-18]